MAEGTQPKFAGLQRLPPWDLMATAAQLFEQQEHTHVMLKTYQTFLSDLISKFNEKNTKKKAQKVETAATDVRTAYSQYIAIASSFLTKTKDTELRKQVKDAMTMAAAEHATFQKKANEVAEAMEGQEEEEEERGRQRQTRQTKVQALKPVKELEPTITAHFKLSGAELEKWCEQMDIWSQASGFGSCTKPVQVAFEEVCGGGNGRKDQRAGGVRGGRASRRTWSLRELFAIPLASCSPGGLTSSCSSARTSRPRASSST